ncbi:MAG: hypothetical protein ACR2HN_10200 [Tepidiformaceae bacterium]
MGGALARAGLFALLAIPALALALSQPGEDARACGTAGPFDFDTLELEDHVAGYGLAIELAVEGKAAQFTYDWGGETIDIRYQGLLAGNRANRTTQPSTGHRIPPTIYKSIAWIEASWSNAGYTVPYGGVGPVLRAPDCGYGLGQITTGMSNNSGTASGRQALIGTHFLFNLAEGVRILADKWNSAPRYRPIAGNGDPAALEDWYYAIWSYNGFAAGNHPLYDTDHTMEWADHYLNPSRNPLRGEVYHCYDPSAPGSGQFGYGDYTYPERVYGCVRYPPTKGNARMWTPQVFNMPDFDREEVASAFSPLNFINCEDANVNDLRAACQPMDFLTSFEDDPETPEDEGVTTHADTSPVANAAAAAAFRGEPALKVDGPATATLAVFSDGTASKLTITVTNSGTWIAPFRVRSTAPWLVARHPNDPSTRTLDGGVAIGVETNVVLTSTPRVTQKGYASQLNVSLNAAMVPPGGGTATLWIEPLFGSGAKYELQITATKAGAPLRYRVLAPGISAE